MHNVVTRKANGKSESERAGLDLEHELPPAENEDVSTETEAISGDAASSSEDFAKLRAEHDLLRDRFARAQAEFDNARRRAAKEQQEFRDFATADAIKTLLPVLDSFERALQANSEAGDFRGGVELIHKQFQDALAKMGLRAIPAKGEPFDPHVHEAIEMVESSDVPDHEVLEELQRGYKLKDRLLRPAMVKVAKNSGI
jgi:molecular chaperone GrpE